MTRLIMLSNRELRRVPLDYKHPTVGEQRDRFSMPMRSLGGDDSDEPAPMFLETYDEALDEWLEERAAWKRGERSKYFEEREGDPYSYEEYSGGPPNPAYYLRHPLPPESDECHYGIQLWQTVSEGTPISPVFPDSDEGMREMARHMELHDTDSILSHLSAAEWYEIISGEAWGTDIRTGEVVR